MLVILGALLVAALVYAASQGMFTPDQTAVTTWAAGSPDIGGKVTNKTGSGCSHVVIHIEELDHNDAVVEKLDIPVGDVQANQTVTWHNHLTQLGGLLENPVAATVTRMKVTSVTCEDTKG